LDSTQQSSQTAAQLDELARRLADGLWIGVYPEVHTADEGLDDQKHLIAAMRDIYPPLEVAAFVDSDIAQAGV
jgi:hypothetical protein